MNAVLETAINTDLPGSLRAIITRDVYAESGTRILVPKGSRVIGTYTNTISAGQTRLQINWSRLIRPDGIDIAVNSPGTDNLGRAGVIGVVDNKMWTQIGAALLVSYIIPNIVNKITGLTDQTVAQTSSTVNGVTTTTTSGNSGAISSSSATSKFGSIAENAINSALPSQPTITIDQGTLITIFTQADLIFPTEEALAKQQVRR
jgi:type IV secretion system protein VirB10